MRSLLHRKAPAPSPTAEATVDASARRDQHIDRSLQGTHDVLKILNGLADSVIVCKPLKVVLGVAAELVEWTQKARANKKDCAALAQKTLAYMQVLSSRVPDTEDVPPKLREDLDKVCSDLKEICNSMSSLPKKNSYIKAVVFREQIADGIKDCQRKLEDSQKHFLFVSAVELRKDVQNILQHTIARNVPILADEIQFSAALPPPPLHLFGRDELVEQAISCLVSSDSPSHLAILGTGGIGKTSLAVALLHHPKIQKHYGTSRYSVPCDSLSSADSLVTALLKTLGASADRKDALNTLITCLRTSSPVMVLLDNFESPWMSANQTALTNVLHHLSATAGTKVVVTMRADSPPAPGTIEWTSLKPDVLCPQDAQSLFLSINKQTQQNEYDDLQMLLEEVDYLPLAIKLLAEIKQSTPCSRLLIEWHKKRTSFVATNNYPSVGDHLTSLDISIELSLDSDIVASAPEAKELLHLLAHLPDGIRAKNGENDPVTYLEQMDLGFQDPYNALKILCMVALVSLDLQGSIKVLSPIRHYMLGRGINNQHMTALYLYYSQLVGKYSLQESTSPEFLNALKWLSPEIGNITGLLKQLPKDGWTDAVRYMALSLAQFQYWDYPSTEVIDLLMAYEKESSGSIPADIIYAKARLLECMQDYAKASELYMQAQGEYSENKNHLGVAQCLQSLGDICKLQGQYREATPKLEQALSEFQEIGSRLGALQCLQSLGNIHRMHDQYRKAIPMLNQALSEFQDLGNRLGAAQCLQSLSEIHRMQHQYVEAIPKLEQALLEFEEIGNRRGAAQCLQSLSNINMLHCHYKDASIKLEQALSQFQWIGDREGAANCLKSLGNIYRMHGQYVDATSKLEQALSEFQRIGSRLGAAQCLRSLGDIHRMQGQYREASLKLEQALSGFQCIEDRLGAAECLQILGIIHMKQSQYEEAISKLEKALSVFQDIEDCLETSRTFQHLAKVYSSMGNYQRALQVLCQSLPFAQTCGISHELAWYHMYRAENYASLHQYKEALEAIHMTTNLFLTLEACEDNVEECDGYILKWTGEMQGEMTVTAEPRETHHYDSVN